MEEDSGQEEEYGRGEEIRWGMSRDKVEREGRFESFILDWMVQTFECGKVFLI